jgi:hypothetical protein
MIDAVLQPAPGHRIQAIELLNPFNPKETPDSRLSILDIKARDESGRQFNVEMQMLAFPYYEKRILYYLCKLHQQQLHEGEDYLELKPSISVSFLDHVLFPHVRDYHLRFRLLEQEHRFPLTEDLEFHILELPKFTDPIPIGARLLNARLFILLVHGPIQVGTIYEIWGGPIKSLLKRGETQRSLRYGLTLGVACVVIAGAMFGAELFVIQKTQPNPLFVVIVLLVPLYFATPVVAAGLVLAFLRR